MQAKREHLKKRGLSKELDQVVENEELDYSPAKGGTRDGLTFGALLRQTAPQGDGSRNTVQQQALV